MAKAMMDNSLASLGCMAHALQSRLKDSQRLEAFTPCLLTPAGCADPVGD